MPIPMQVSLPLALHLNRPILTDVFTNRHFKPDEMYTDGTTIEALGFIEQSTERANATIAFASILSTIHDHEDWSQLHSFFNKRYSKFESLGSRNERKITPRPRVGFPKETKSTTAKINTNPSTVGLAASLVDDIASATRMAEGNMLGPSPLFCALGPSISVAIGPAGYMDLIYAGKAPSTPPSHHPPSTSTKGGRGRTLSAWHTLFATIADWVYEYEHTYIQAFGATYRFKYRMSDELSLKKLRGKVIEREYLDTDAIHGADGIRDVFAQLANERVRFQGIEWDFLSLEVEEEVERAFVARFGPKPAVREDYAGSLMRRVDRLNYGVVDASVLRACPESYRGEDWERWLLSIDGGNVVVVTTVFQALWAVALLTYLPVHINILAKDEKYPEILHANCVYI